MKWFKCKEKLPRHNQYVYFVESHQFDPHKIKKGKFIRALSGEPMYFMYKVKFDTEEDTERCFRFTLKNGKSNLNIVRMTQVYCWMPIPQGK